MMHIQQKREQVDGLSPAIASGERCATSNTNLRAFLFWTSQWRSDELQSSFGYTIKTVYIEHVIAHVICH